MAQPFHNAASQRERRTVVQRLLPGGTAGNARLTSLTGLVLIVLLFVEGLTILGIRALITPHAFIGFMLIPPVGLKLLSVGYKFFSYYAGRTTYRAVGPPQPFLRLLGPFLIAATLLLFASGVILILSVPGDGGPWRRIHTLSFLIWFSLMTVHVLKHFGRAVSLSWADLVASQRGTEARDGVQTASPGCIGHPLPAARPVPGTLDRSVLLAGSILLGIALAVAFLPWDNTWATWLSAFRGDG